MTTTLRRALIAVLVVLSSAGLSTYWGDYPDSFPAPLRWLGVKLVYLLLPLTPDQLEDIEFVFSAVSALLIMSGGTWLVLRAAKRLR
ncbi:MAG: hypothetical protein V7642_160 [Burkholderiales bacterium]|jgi:hypothetical protein